MLNGKRYVYPNIISLMARNGDTLKSLAAELDMGYQALSTRLQGEKAFELPEIYVLMKKYHCTFDYLFEKDSKTA